MGRELRSINPATGEGMHVFDFRTALALKIAFSPRSS
jgi:hypothetical protein